MTAKNGVFSKTKADMARLKKVRTGFQINLNYDEKRLIQEAADRAGVRVAVFIRDAALNEAKKR